MLVNIQHFFCLHLPVPLFTGTPSIHRQCYYSIFHAPAPLKQCVLLAVIYALGLMYFVVYYCVFIFGVFVYGIYFIIGQKYSSTLAGVGMESKKRTCTAGMQMKVCVFSFKNLKFRLFQFLPILWSLKLDLVLIKIFFFPFLRLSLSW